MTANRVRQNKIWNKGTCSKVEYDKIRSGIQELVDKFLFSDMKTPELPKQKLSVLRKDKILTALEEIVSELAIQLNLTTLQIKSVVNTSVDVLAKHFGLKPWQNHELHERVTSQVRAKLKYEDLDNKDARLRILEEKIEMDIKHLKLTAKQAKRLEALMVEEEALRESLSKMERLRMLKRVIADIKDDFKTEKKEQESGPPKLTSVNLIAINNLIREKAIENAVA
ncbi:hypothetical protein QZH41_019940 [Actinostola sp. cb2023]|nr:hypothetical protein QZH41_019940 [Actinostola sp. cb2023]